MINNVVLVGRLTKDPDLKYTGNGQAVATFTLAVNRNFTNQSGEREADFINCVIWRKPAETLANYARKGTLLGVTGRIQTRNYENQQGQRVYVTEVVVENFQLLESKNSNSSQNTSTASVPNAQTNNYAPDNQNATQTNLGVNPINDFEATTIDINDDDLPF
ncbi:single-stranded DNA-binding protein [Enterococcus dispar]|uniref:Single-stranded DNA-binding protein n=1 Tax=Enterococcus dispar ATCC 51266 TaxID=1139219 RepID=S1NK24_9ENTE|nr:single-stranded DNA-binding protein [Enterococcus dispar]EOT39021.1 single-strand DNA-binding protein [Enterococcus dispar ATCC 51266]EOT43782.1 single-strand DNA-binding protein [Enterococcus dispar ATCC 51266]EOW85546.1 single-strand DNA-binding protein [Enterococcus dispar ATCC 51266]EOW86078.1 single-strand DNA-binding protein [Enterococcus dispar ATCC 51266]OJG35035.1 single-strand DNA-binding protein [Enterococcus dispar]